MMEPDRVNC